MPSPRNKDAQVLSGIYQHYKGKHYQVLGPAADSNEDGRVVIVYIGLELDGARPGPRMHVRTAQDFYAIVDKTTGEIMDYPYPTSACPRRFTYVGTGWPGE